MEETLSLAAAGCGGIDGPINGNVGMTATVAKRCSNKSELRVKVWSDGRESVKVLTSEGVFFSFFLMCGGWEGWVWQSGWCVCRIL